MGEMANGLATILTAPAVRADLPSGLPDIGPEHRLPEDVAEFFAVAGGLRVGDGDQWTRVLSPNEVVASNPEIVGEQVPDDISSSWYLIAITDNGDYLSIDLSPDRLGRCYDSDFEVHGVAGSDPIIALTFTEFIVRLVESNGAAYWRESGFQSHGDAYD